MYANGFGELQKQVHSRSNALFLVIFWAYKSADKFCGVQSINFVSIATANVIEYKQNEKTSEKFPPLALKSVCNNCLTVSPVLIRFQKC